MQLVAPLKQLYAKNKLAFLAVFMLNLLMLWFSFNRFHGMAPAEVEGRLGLHNMVLVGNFLMALWMCWKLEWKIEDYRKIISNSEPDKAHPVALILTVSVMLFASAANLFLFLPLFSWLESAGQLEIFVPKFLSTFLCSVSFIQIFACGWAMNLNNREQFEQEKNHNLMLTLFRSFIDFYFYYMALACFGLIMYQMIGNDLAKVIPHFKLADVIFCIFAADVMLVKALYELSTKKPFLWSSKSHWPSDLPMGMIKILAVTLVAVLAPMPKGPKSGPMAHVKDQAPSAPNFRQASPVEDPELQEQESKSRLPASSAMPKSIFPDHSGDPEKPMNP